jgi:hypothetical protein
MAAVGAGEEIEGVHDARLRVLRPGGIARAHRVAQAGDLVLAGFDHRAQQRRRVGERAQFGEGDAACRARHVGEVDAEGIVELPALDLGRRLRRQRLLRPETSVGRNARDGVARGQREAREQARGQRRFQSSRRHAVFPRRLAAVGGRGRQRRLEKGYEGIADLARTKQEHME